MKRKMTLAKLKIRTQMLYLKSMTNIRAYQMKHLCHHQPENLPLTILTKHNQKLCLTHPGLEDQMLARAKKTRNRKIETIKNKKIKFLRK